MLRDISLQSPVLRRTILTQFGITVVFALIAAFISGEQGFVSALLGGLVNVFASIIYVVVADFGLRHARATGLWPLLRAEIIKLVFIALQLGVIIKFYAALVLPALFVTFLVTLLAWRMALMQPRASAKIDVN